MALNKRLSTGLRRFFMIAVLLIAIGILCQLIGALASEAGYDKWIEGRDQDDAVLEARGDLERTAGGVAVGMAQPLVLAGIGTALAGLLWSRIPALEGLGVCQECFHAVDKGVNFCSECGNELRKKKKKFKGSRS